MVCVEFREKDAVWVRDSGWARSASRAEKRRPWGVTAPGLGS